MPADNYFLKLKPSICESGVPPCTLGTPGREDQAPKSFGRGPRPLVGAAQYLLMDVIPPPFFDPTRAIPLVLSLFPPQPNLSEDNLSTPPPFSLLSMSPQRTPVWLCLSRSPRPVTSVLDNPVAGVLALPFLIAWHSSAQMIAPATLKAISPLASWHLTLLVSSRLLGVPSSPLQAHLPLPAR